MGRNKTAAGEAGLPGDTAGFGTVLTLLGTGGGPLAAGPRYSRGRSGTASLLTVQGNNYLVDCGPGTVRRLGQAGVPVNGLAGVLVTHAHSDHIADLFAMFLLNNPGGKMGEYPHAVPVWGPGPSATLPPPYGGLAVPLVDPDAPAPGIRDFFEHQLSSFRYDVNVRNTEQAPTAVDYGTLYDIHEIELPRACGATPLNPAPRMKPFTVFEDDGVKVTATLARHAPVFPAFAFRFDTADGSVTFSGDSGESENIAELAAGTDVLVHEVVDVDFYARTSGSVPVVEFMESAHTPAAGVGRVAARAGAGSVVLSHILPGDPLAVTDAQWRACVAAEYGGPVVVGHDLARIGVGRRRWSRQPDAGSLKVPGGGLRAP